MNKGFFLYFTSGLKKTVRYFKTISFFEKILLLIYLFFSLIGSCFILLQPIVAVSLMNIGKMIDEDRPFSFGQIFKGCTRKAAYIDLLLSFLIIDCFLALIAWLLSMPSTFMFTYGSSNLYPFAIALTVIDSLLILAISIPTFFYFIAMPYVARFAKADKLDVSDILTNSYIGMRGNCPTAFGIIFFYSLIISLFLGVGILIGVLCFLYGGFAGAIIGSILLLGYLILMIFILPVFCYGFMASLEMLFKDVISKERVVILRQKSKVEDEEYYAESVDDEEELEEDLAEEEEESAQ